MDVGVAVGGMGVGVLVGIGVDVGAGCVVAQAVTSNNTISGEIFFFIVFPSLNEKPNIS
jgi:hypothetical protein